MLLLMMITIAAALQDSESNELIAAVVDGYQISEARVQQQITTSLKGVKNSLPDSLRSKLRTEATEHLVNRHLVYLAIKGERFKVGDGPVAMELSKLEDRLAEIGKTLDDHLQESKSTQVELEYEFEWKLLWAKYLKKKLTNDNLEKFYRRDSRRYDGTEVRVSHLLLVNDTEAVTDKVYEIREQVVSGKLSWSDAVKKHSVAKSSVDKDGEIGWVNYDGPMVPAFCLASMKLQRGEISKPIATVFGVHLIRCLEVRPGKVGFVDAREIVRKDAMKFLFKKLANQQRQKSTIKMIGVGTN